MKKIIGGAIVTGALFLLQVAPTFAMTHWEQAQWDTQQAVCMLSLANSASNLTIKSNDVTSAITFYQSAEEHIGMAKEETTDWKEMMNIDYVSHLVPAARTQAESALKWPTFGLWAKVLAAYKAGVMVNKEFMKFVNVTNGACE